MGLWVNTTYVNHPNGAGVAQALEALCLAEGMQRIPAPAQRETLMDQADIVAQYFGGQNSTFCDNIVSVDTLIGHKPFTAPGGLALYFKWPGPTRQRYAPCASWEEYQAAIRRK